MIKMIINKDDVECTVEGKCIDIMAETGVAMVYAIRALRDCFDNDDLIMDTIYFAVEQEKEMER